MDDLRDRLNRLMGSVERGSWRPSDGHQGSWDGETGRHGRLQERLREMTRRQGALSWGEEASGSTGQRRNLEEVSGGREVETRHGTVFEIAQSFRGGYRHGRYRLEDFCSTDLGVLDLFCGRSGAVSTAPEGFLFLDLETTGLSLGTGTYAFLIGLGFFREGRYQVRQFLLRRFEEEAAVMSNLLDLMGEFEVLVTFNGKRFDLPVLETRFCMCGGASDVLEREHWDLMYPSRRLWRDRAENCRLSTLERRELGVDRGLEDIDGSRIPEVYYRYVHEGDTRDLDRIVFHNAMDVMSLTTLATHTARCLTGRDPSGTNLLGVGRFFETRGMVAESRECYEVAAGPGGRFGERAEAKFRLAARLKREGKRAEAVGVWEEVVEMGGNRLVESCEEIAKFYEHERRDFDGAIRFVRLALDRVGARESGRRDRLVMRLRRLERRR